MATAELPDSPEDSFNPTKLFEFTGSPDTLQRIDATRKNDASALVSDANLGFSASPNGSYHEYSDDSADSFKRGGRGSNPVHSHSPNDVIMAGAFDGMDYDEFFDQDAPFMPEPETDSKFPAKSLGDDGFMDHHMDHQHVDFDNELLSTASSTVPSGLQSPGMPTIAPAHPLPPQEHHRHDSVRSPCILGQKTLCMLTCHPSNARWIRQPSNGRRRRPGTSLPCLIW